MKNFLIPFFLLWTLALSAVAPQTTSWLMKQGAIDVLPPHQEAELLNLFSVLGIQVEAVPADKWEFVGDVSKRLESSQEWRTIWQGRHVKLYTTEEGRLRITPLRAVHHLHELTLEEELEMETTAIAMSSVFLEVFGSKDYVRWIPLGAEAGQIGPQLYSELIPNGTEVSNRISDAEEKTRTNLYILLGKASLQPGLRTEQLSRIERIAQERLYTWPIEVIQPDPPRHTVQWINIPTAGRLLVIALLEWLQEVKQAAIPLAASDIRSVVPETYTRQTRKNCAFCDSEVVNAQLISHRDQHMILANRSAYFPLCHLMSIPHAHVTDRSQLTLNEILEKFRIWTRTDFIFRHHLNSTATSIITRSGPGAGQTVFHDHDHMIAIRRDLFPIWILRMLMDFSTDQEFPNHTQEQLNAISQQLQPLFDPC